MLKAEHDSQSLYSRTPFGAAVCGQRVRIRIMIGGCGWPDKVLLKCRYDEKSFLKQMHFYCVMADMNVYEAFITLPEKPCLVFYSFEITADGRTCFYGNNEQRLGGVGKLYDEYPAEYQITVYDKNFKTPQWFKDGIMYQIFPDRFYKTENYSGLDKARDIIKRKWGEVPFYRPEQFGGQYLANDCFGGSLKGIEEKLDYLKELGIDAIYLNPIFEAASNHKYNTGNYERVDELFGDEESFAGLCKKAEEMGIRIILDGVFNHTGSDSLYFNKENNYDSVGAYQSKESKYFKWYSFEEYPDKYDCWWGIKTLPHVNELEPSYVDYILTGENSIIKKWIRLGASGWRLDVADELPDEFIKILRTELKKEKEDAVIIGEVWEDASNKTAYGKLREYFGGFELDSVMNYPFRNYVISYVKGEISAHEFNRCMMSLKENYPRPAYYAAMNFLSSHDTERIITKLSNLPDYHDLSRQQQAELFLNDEQRKISYARLKLAVFLQFTLPGVACVFYGDEAGAEGYADPFCRMCYPWGNEKEEIMQYYKKFISVKKSYEAFKSGEVEFVYGEGQACGFVRYTDDEFYFMALNTSSEYDWNAAAELGRFGVCGIENIFEDEKHICDFGRFNIHLEPMSFKIFKCEVCK